MVGPVQGDGLNEYECGSPRVRQVEGLNRLPALAAHVDTAECDRLRAVRQAAHDRVRSDFAG